MKKIFCITLILFTFALLFIGAEAAAAGGFKPILKDGMAVKSDGTLWRFSEVWNEVALEKEEETENVIDFEDEVLQMNLDKHILYILKSDNTFC